MPEMREIDVQKLRAGASGQAGARERVGASGRAGAKGGSVARGIGAWAAIAAAPALTWLLGLTTWRFVEAVGGRTGNEAWLGSGAWTVDQAVVVIVGAAGTVAAAYLCVTAVALIASHARPSRTRRSRVARAAPVVWQRVVAVAMGMALGSGMAAPAMAAESEDSLTHAGWAPAPVASAGAVHTDAVQPDHAPAPAPAEPLADVTERATASDGSRKDPPSQPDTRPAAPTEPVTIKDGAGDAPADVAPAVAPPPAADAIVSASDARAESPDSESPDAPDAHEYTVERGDSLWKITAELMGGSPSDAAVANTWPLLYDANRDVIGANPSLIHPGQVLTIPDGVRA